MNKSHESYLVPFFKEMNKSFPEAWCVLHSYDTLPFYSESDVDMAFSGNDLSTLELIIKKVAHAHGWQVYQKLWYDIPSCYYYVLKENRTGTFLAIDFLIDNNGIGRYGFDTKILTNECIMVKGLFPIPNHEVAFCYKLVKRIVKKRPLENDQPYLIKHYKSAETKKIQTILLNQFGSKGKDLIIRYISTNDPKLNVTEINDLNHIWKKINAKNKNYFNKKYWEIKRTINRVLFPCGMIVEVPQLPKEELGIFIDLLEKKTDLLFRFVKLNTSNSIVNSFNGFVGSTLVICPVNSFKLKKAIKYRWLKPSFIAVNSRLDVNNINEMVDEYYDAILQALLVRVRL